MQHDFLQAIEITKKLIHAFYVERNMDIILSYLAPNISWFGAGPNQTSLNLEEVVTFFQQELPTALPFHLCNENYTIAAQSDDSCIVTALLLFKPTTTHGINNVMKLRFSFCFQWQNNRFLIVHIHSSIPSEKPLTNGSLIFINHKIERNPLQLDIRHTNQIMQTIVETLPLAIKIMEDSPNYPCFCINRNFLNILGYDYDSFINMTQGSALAIVCPADRQNFLSDLNICFNNGIEYSTEYQAVKRDGSLLRVLEWGKKTKNHDGIDLINGVLIPLPIQKVTCATKVHPNNTSIHSDEAININNLTIYPKARRVQLNSELIELTPIEFNILLLMTEHVNQTIPIHIFYEKFWDKPQLQETSRVLQAHIANLRNKLKFRQHHDIRIINVYGKGYELSTKNLI